MSLWEKVLESRVPALYSLFHSGIQELTGNTSQSGVHDMLAVLSSPRFLSWPSRAS
jgi:hypothetical protein